MLQHVQLIALVDCDVTLVKNVLELVLGRLVLLQLGLPLLGSSVDVDELLEVFIGDHCVHDLLPPPLFDLFLYLLVMVRMMNKL